MCQQPYRDLGFKLKSIGWAGREVVSGDFLDIVADVESRSQVIGALFQFLGEARSSWDLLHLGELLEDGETVHALKNLGSQYGLPVRSQEARICPYITLPSSFDEYLASLSSSTRYHIRRRLREVLEKRGATIQLCETPEEMSSGLETLIQLHLARWRKDGLPGTMGRPGFAAFLHQICTEPPPNSKVRLYRLTYEGQVIAALLVFHFGQSALYYQAGWDPESALAAQSPAVVLMAHSIADAIASGLRYYEFLRGDEGYKSHWTQLYRKTDTVLVARSLLAKEYLRAARWKDSVKEKLNGGLLLGNARLLVGGSGER